MALKEKAEIVDADGLRRIITRIAHEIVERNKGVDGLVLVGIRRRGVPLASRLSRKIQEFEGKAPIEGSLDVTLYRDDLSQVAHQPIVGSNQSPVDIDDKAAGPGGGRGASGTGAGAGRWRPGRPARRGRIPGPSRPRGRPRRGGRSPAMSTAMRIATSPDPDAMWTAFLARDARWDGRFVAGVRT